MQNAIPQTGSQRQPDQNQKPTLIWDWENRSEAEIESYSDFYNADLATQDQLHGDALVPVMLSDDSYFEGEWNHLSDSLTELMDRMNPKRLPWKATVHNFGWRNVHGTKILEASSGERLLWQILPDTECRYHIYDRRNRIEIQNWHHDSPTGNEWYVLKPLVSE